MSDIDDTNTVSNSTTTKGCGDTQNMESIKVAIRIRPMSAIENEGGYGTSWKYYKNTGSIESKDEKYSSSFDYLFPPSSTNKDIYTSFAQPVINKALNGINGTIFAYGQTSSGKTFTMLGSDKEPGLVPRTIKSIFSQKSDSITFKFAFVELYNENLKDLLYGTALDLRTTAYGETIISGLESIECTTEAQALKILKAGDGRRRVGSTLMNDKSSRSHTIFRIQIENTTISDGVPQSTYSILNLVDLAGSERASDTGATGIRLREGAAINRSLLTLVRVITLLSQQSECSHIPYRDSKLTRLLSDSLGGNSATAIICNMTPAACHFSQTLSTLKFAGRAKNVETNAVVNTIQSPEAMVKHYKKQVEFLKDRLDKVANVQLLNSLEKQVSVLNAENTALKEKLSEYQNGTVYSDGSEGNNPELSEFVPLELGNVTLAFANQVEKALDDLENKNETVDIGIDSHDDTPLPVISRLLAESASLAVEKNGWMQRYFTLDNYISKLILNHSDLLESIPYPHVNEFYMIFRNQKAQISCLHQQLEDRNENLNSNGNSKTFKRQSIGIAGITPRDSLNFNIMTPKQMHLTNPNDTNKSIHTPASNLSNMLLDFETPTEFKLRNASTMLKKSLNTSSVSSVAPEKDLESLMISRRMSELERTVESQNEKLSQWRDRHSKVSFVNESLREKMKELHDKYLEAMKKNSMIYRSSISSLVPDNIVLSTRIGNTESTHRFTPTENNTDSFKTDVTIPEPIDTEKYNDIDWEQYLKVVDENKALKSEIIGLINSGVNSECNDLLINPNAENSGDSSHHKTTFLRDVLNLNSVNSVNDRNTKKQPEIDVYKLQQKYATMLKKNKKSSKAISEVNAKLSESNTTIKGLEQRNELLLHEIRDVKNQLLVSQECTHSSADMAIRNMKKVNSGLKKRIKDLVYERDALAVKIKSLKKVRQDARKKMEKMVKKLLTLEKNSGYIGELEKENKIFGRTVDRMERLLSSGNNEAENLTMQLFALQKKITS